MVFARQSDKRNGLRGPKEDVARRRSGVAAHAPLVCRAHDGQLRRVATGWRGLRRDARFDYVNDPNARRQDFDYAHVNAK